MIRSDSTRLRPETSTSDSRMNRHESIADHSNRIMHIHDSKLSPSLSVMNPVIPVDSAIIPYNQLVQHDVLFQYIRYTFYHYIPTKPNKKKMKQWIEAIPYFLPDRYQNTFFKIIRTHPIETYWDSRDKMEEYGYLLYSSFHESLKLSYQNKEDYQLALYINKTKHKQMHNMIYFMVVFLFILILYKWIL